MKKILILLFLFVMVFGFAHAQQNNLQKENLNLPEIKMQIPSSRFSENNFNKLFRNHEDHKPDTIRYQIVDIDNAADLSKRGKFSHITNNGAVYILYADNMLCLVPDTKKLEHMPVGKYGLKNIDRMPNAIPSTRIIQ